MEKDVRCQAMSECQKAGAQDDLACLKIWVKSQAVQVQITNQSCSPLEKQTEEGQDDWK